MINRRPLIYNSRPIPAASWQLNALRRGKAGQGSHNGLCSAGCRVIQGEVAHHALKGCIHGSLLQGDASSGHASEGGREKAEEAVAQGASIPVGQHAIDGSCGGSRLQHWLQGREATHVHSHACNRIARHAARQAVWRATQARPWRREGRGVQARAAVGGEGGSSSRARTYHLVKK